MKRLMSDSFDAACVCDTGGGGPRWADCSSWPSRSEVVVTISGIGPMQRIRDQASDAVCEESERRREAIQLESVSSPEGGQAIVQGRRRGLRDRRRRHHTTNLGPQLPPTLDDLQAVSP